LKELFVLSSESVGREHREGAKRAPYQRYDEPRRTAVCSR
jgi:hypothetical protein